ncbi:hypothetical protein K438DRAFT_2082836 [Mycena galopus ATCC 62051]|nr:hypothetical protein K438DRAFT_2082836 [Mycena galopus ATCC 62051]
MLLLLILIYLLSKNGSAAPPPLDTRSSTVSCDDINNCRQLSGVVWGCLATIFTCTWVSVHPNVPPPDLSWLALLWCRLKMMLFGVVTPEIITAFSPKIESLRKSRTSRIRLSAIAQNSLHLAGSSIPEKVYCVHRNWYQSAWASARGFAQRPKAACGLCGFCASSLIAEAVSRSGYPSANHLAADRGELGCMAGLAVRQFLGARMLSKEYGFSKTHGYPIATKEQLDSVTLGPEFQKAIRGVNAKDIMDKSKGDALSKGMALAQVLWFITQCAARVHQRLTVTELEVATLGFAVVNIFIWLLWWNKPLGVQRPIVIGPPKPADAQPIISGWESHWEQFGTAIFGPDSSYKYDPLSSTSVPSFWSLPLEKPEEIIQMGLMWFISFTGTLFGAVHCAAWNAHFPSTAEMWMWRVCSPVITAIPSLTSFSITFSSIAVGKNIFDGKNLDKVIYGTAVIMFFGGAPVYIFTRLILIVLPLAALRALPPSAFMDVNWSIYIPHINLPSRLVLFSFLSLAAIYYISVPDLTLPKPHVPSDIVFGLCLPVIWNQKLNCAARFLYWLLICFEIPR